MVPESHAYSQAKTWKFSFDLGKRMSHDILRFNLKDYKNHFSVETWKRDELRAWVTAIPNLCAKSAGLKKTMLLCGVATIYEALRLKLLNSEILLHPTRAVVWSSTGRWGQKEKGEWHPSVLLFKHCTFNCRAIAVTKDLVFKIFPHPSSLLDLNPTINFVIEILKAATCGNPEKPLVMRASLVR